MGVTRRTPSALALVVALTLAACGGGPAALPRSSPNSGSRVLATFRSEGTVLQVEEIAHDLDTVWSLAWDRDGSLWYTERPGRLTRVGGQPQRIDGVDEVGEGGLMGLEIDALGRKYVMYTGIEDNRIVRLEPDGSQRVLVAGIAKADFHNGGRIRFGPDAALYASTGDASKRGLASSGQSLNGKVLRIDPHSGATRVFTSGHRNVQGLCFSPTGRFLATEHGPDGDDEVNELRDGLDGGWPATTGNGMKNYEQSVAPAGCAVYDAALLPRWRGSLLFSTLRGSSLRRLSFNPDGSVKDEEVLLQDRFGRLRDVSVGPDGSVYMATSNRDGRTQPKPGDDRILRIAPAPTSSGRSRAG